jgi:hypothetical protein
MKRVLFVLLCLVVLCPIGVFAYLVNPEFEASLNRWWALYENSDHWTITRGTVEWSSAHGGSAHLAVSGSPEVADLLAFTTAAIEPGDTIRAMVSHTGFGNAGSLTLNIGNSGLPEAPHCGQIVYAPNLAGDYEIWLVADKTYTCGSPIWFHLVMFPGSAEAWIHWVQVTPGITTSVDTQSWGSLKREANE